MLMGLWSLFVGTLLGCAFAPAFSYVNNDTAALLAFKNSVTADPGNLLQTWNPGSIASYCTWYGVTCDAYSKRVISLNFTGSSTSRLSGTLPDSIGSLAELRGLTISHHAFSGGIPLSIARLQFLEVLELQGNNFSGTVPYQITALLSLRFLNLSFNSFSGGIPSALIGSGNLGVIDLSNNRLAGKIRISGSSQCVALRHLKLSNNMLVKSIPREIGRCNNLRTLLLDGNILQGPIPADVGQISELRVLDVSTNSLTGRIPKELANCRKLSVLVLTNSSNFVGNEGAVSDDARLEFNAFEDALPYELFMLPNLQVLWAPRANLYGRLPGNWSNSCSLRVINLGLNSLTGMVPEGLAMCKNLTFLDLSSNYLVGRLPFPLQVPCLMYFNVSRNNMSGVLPNFGKNNCGSGVVSYGLNRTFLDLEDIQIVQANIPVWGPRIIDDDSVIFHDYSWNHFMGTLPSFSLGNEFSATKNRFAYRLYLNNNRFSGTLPAVLFSNCNDLVSLNVNLNANSVSGDVHELLLNCLQVREFEAAYNQIGGSLDPSIGNLTMLQSFDLRGNRLSGSLPSQLGKLKVLRSILLGGNNLSGGIPSQLGQLTSLLVLDLSNNKLTGPVPSSLSGARNLEALLLNNNMLSGQVSSSFSALYNLTILNLSFNNFSGHIPKFRHSIDCDWFKGNPLLDKCPGPSSVAPAKGSNLSNKDGNERSHRNKKLFIIVVVTCGAILLGLCLLVVLVCIFWKRKSGGMFSSSRGIRVSSLREKLIVTFTDVPAELSYDGVVRATGNFSIRNLIGTGGFGSTYKAEILPGYLVAIKRLSIGRFQCVKQFDAEIRTLGRIRHKNLVTLIGYYVGESEMFLIYNYLSGGNLETFIHDRSGKNKQWSVIYKIALDMAQALTYVHNGKPKIVHRDIKPSNILLDEELNAYLSDFGLARLLEVSQTHATTDVEGTFGYVAPEYATTCRVSDKSDVYSFGIVLLELLSGKKSLDPSFSEYGNGFNIVAWAKLLMKEGRSSELFTLELQETGPEEGMLGMLELASKCTAEFLRDRPSMAKVLEELEKLNS